MCVYTVEEKGIAGFSSWFKLNKADLELCKWESHIMSARKAYTKSGPWLDLYTIKQVITDNRQPLNHSINASNASQNLAVDVNGPFFSVVVVSCSLDGCGLP